MTELALQPTTELVSAPLDHQIADYLTSLLGEARPRRVAQMLDPGGDKYRDLAKSKSLTWLMLEGHAAGSSTYAATLDQHGSSRAGVIEVDQGGRSAVLATLAAAHQLGLSCYAIAIDNPISGHSGGHVWFIYANCADSADIRAQLQQVVTAAGLPTDTELWPCGQVIRLPFGYHRWAETRGELLTQDGQIVDLDSDLGQGVYIVNGLPTNATPPTSVNQFTEVEKPSNQAGNIPFLKESPGERAAGRASLDDVKARFNAEHTIESVLDQWGKATETRDGWACDCGVGHTHETTLYISKRGRLFSYSPRCHLHTTKGWDAFGLYVKLFHNDNVIEAAKALNPIQARPHAPQPATNYRTAEMDADAERKRAERRAAAERRRDTIISRAAIDDLPWQARLLLDMHLELAGQRGWHRASIARMAEMLGRGDRWVQRFNEKLIDIYVSRNQPDVHGTAFWTLLETPIERVDTPETDDLGVITSEAETANDHPSKDLELVRGGLSSPPEKVYAPALRQSHGRYLVTDGVRFGGWSATEAGAWEKWAGPAAQTRSSTEFEPAEREKVVEQHLCSAEPAETVSSILFEDSDQPECATYTPVELPRHTPYSGTTSRQYMSDTARRDLALETMRRLPDADAGDEGVNFSPSFLVGGSTVLPPKSRNLPDKPRAIDRYLVELAGMSEAELGGELIKHRRTLSKFKGAHWLAGVREKLALVEHEIDARELHGAGLASPPLTSSGPQARPAFQQVGVFL